MALLREKRSAVHDFLLHTAASGGDIGMVCGGDVTAHFQFIPAEDASWQALGLGPDRAAHRPSAGLAGAAGGRRLPALAWGRRVCCGEIFLRA